VSQFIFVLRHHLIFLSGYILNEIVLVYAKLVLWIRMILA